MNEARFEDVGNGAYRFSGPLVFDTVASLYERFATELRRAGDVTLNLEQVTRVDSAGLALLVEGLRLARSQKGRIRFVNIPSQLQALIRVSGLGEAFSLGERCRQP